MLAWPAAVVQAKARLFRFNVATANDQHCGDAQLFGVGNLRFERRGAEIGILPTPKDTDRGGPRNHEKKIAYAAH
jgi:hypothetical protein